MEPIGLRTVVELITIIQILNLNITTKARELIPKTQPLNAPRPLTLVLISSPVTV